METLLADWPGEFVVVRRDQPTGTWIFIAIHSLTLGPAMGGCRMKTYPTPTDGLQDALRLAEGMTYKWASIDFQLGGGKSVLAVPRPLEGAEREGLFERYGDILESLGGIYACGPDLGTTPDDMTVIGRRTKYVHGAARDGHGPLDPGPYTALGVFQGIKAALRHRFGSDTISGRTVLVQGAGDVGYPLGVMLKEAGATVLVSDADAGRAERLAKATGGRVVPNDKTYTTECDVYAPCAVGATLNADTIPLLRCAIVAGSANNQLATDADAARLHERGILYAPDYVINAGGANAIPLLGAGSHTPEQVREQIRRYDAVLTEIFAEAKARNVSPLEGAKARAERILTRSAPPPSS
ncbi:MAG: Glu/Leu/Phe/Val dehydrogenase dimerization domain-containing protein [Gemmatimonadales bacterium]